MLDELHKKQLINESRYLTIKGQIYYKERIAGKSTSYKIGHLTGYTPEYVRLVLGGFMRVTARNIRILQAIENTALEYHSV